MLHYSIVMTMLSVSVVHNVCVLSMLLHLQMALRDVLSLYIMIYVMIHVSAVCVGLGAV